jgi:hypothetical protein
MSRPTYIRGEILPPLSKSIDVTEKTSADLTFYEDLNYIATWLDDRFVIPGTQIRFGLDALIGWIPGLGDALAAFASMFIVAAAWKRGAARITVLRMMLNLTIENVLGAIPIVGDFAHVAWKANRRNYDLLIRDQQSLRRHTWQDWLFVTGACLLICLLFLGPVVLLIYLFRSHRSLF